MQCLRACVSICVCVQGISILVPYLATVYTHCLNLLLMFQTHAVSGELTPDVHKTSTEPKATDSAQNWKSKPPISKF